MTVMRDDSNSQFLPRLPDKFLGHISLKNSEGDLDLEIVIDC